MAQFKEIKTDTTKFVTIFSSAKTHLKHPRIIYTLPDKSEIKFYLAGSASRYAGSVLMTNNKSYGDSTNKWYGHIPLNHTDKVYFTDAVDPNLHTTILKLLNDPIAALKVNGQEFSNCCFCGIELTNKASLAAGYGPVCAAKWDLPWGEINTDDDLDIISNLGL